MFASQSQPELTFGFPQVGDFRHNVTVRLPYKQNVSGLDVAVHNANIVDHLKPYCHVNRRPGYINTRGFTETLRVETKM